MAQVEDGLGADEGGPFFSGGAGVEPFLLGKNIVPLKRGVKKDLVLKGRPGVVGVWPDQALVRKNLKS